MKSSPPLADGVDNWAEWGGPACQAEAFDQPPAYLSKYLLKMEMKMRKTRRRMKLVLLKDMKRRRKRMMKMRMKQVQKWEREKRRWASHT